MKETLQNIRLLCQQETKKKIEVVKDTSPDKKSLLEMDSLVGSAETTPQH